MSNFGYAITSNKKILVEILRKTVGKDKPEPSIARGIGFMIGGNMNNENLKKSNIQAIKAFHIQDTMEEAQKWNQEIFVAAVNECFPRLSWKQVIYELDFPELRITEENEVAYLLTLYKRATNKSPFPIELFVNKIWNNQTTQLNILIYGLGLPQELINFSSKQLQQIKSVIPREKEVLINAAWKSVNFIETLLKLTTPANFQKINELFQEPMKKIPDQLLIALCKVKPMIVSLQNTVVNYLFFYFLEKVQKEGLESDAMLVMKSVAQEAPNIFMINMKNYFDRQRNNTECIKLIVDIVDEIGFISLFTFQLALKMPNTVNLNEHHRSLFDFWINFAFLAAAKKKHHYMLLFLLNMIQKDKPELYKLAKGSLEQRVQTYAKATSKTTTIKNLKDAINKTPFDRQMELDITQTIKDNFIENYNENFSELKLKEYVNMVEQYKSSKDKAYSCIIYSLMDDLQFVDQFPGLIKLWNELIKKNLIEDKLWNIALALIYKEVLRGTKVSLLFLNMIGRELYKWPVFCGFIKLLPNATESIPNIHLYLERRSEYSTFLGFKSRLDLSVIAPENNTFETPDREDIDNINYILNSLTIKNVVENAVKLKMILKHEYYTYFANYFVIQRISLEPNYHKMYCKLLEAMNDDELNKSILEMTYKCSRRILNVGDLSKPSSDAKLLRSFGNWIGMHTLAQNKPILYTELDLKQVLMESVILGTVTQVVQFVRQILRYAKDSIVFKPPNPWTMLILSILSEIVSIKSTKSDVRNTVDLLIQEDLNLKTRIKKKSPRILAEVAVVPEDNILEILEFNEELIQENDNQLLQPIINTQRYPMFKTYPRLKYIVTFAVNVTIEKAKSPQRNQELLGVVLKTANYLVSNDFMGVQNVQFKQKAAFCCIQRIISNYIVRLNADFIFNEIRTNIYQHLLQICTTPLTSDNNVVRALQQVATGIATDNAKLGKEYLESFLLQTARNEIDRMQFNESENLHKYAGDIPTYLFDPTTTTERQQNVYAQYGTAKMAQYTRHPVNKVIESISTISSKLINLADQMKSSTTLFSLDAKHDIVQYLLLISQLVQFCEDSAQLVAQMGPKQRDAAFSETSQLKREIHVNILLTFARAHPVFKNQLRLYWRDLGDYHRYDVVYVPLFTQKLIDTTVGYSVLANSILKNHRNAFAFGYQVVLETPVDPNAILGISPKLLNALASMAHYHKEVDLTLIRPQIEASQQLCKSLIQYVDEIPMNTTIIRNFELYCQPENQNIVTEAFRNTINNPVEYEQTMRVLFVNVMNHYNSLTHCHNSNDIERTSMSFQRVDGFSRLMTHIMYLSTDNRSKMFECTLKMFSMFAIEKATLNTIQFKQRFFLRLFSNLLHYLRTLSTSADQYIQQLILVGKTFLSLSPNRVPVFCFSWMDLITHTEFVPHLLGSDLNHNHHDEAERVYHALLIELFRFLAPYLNAKKELDPSLQLLHRSTICLLLLLNHDFSNFLCNYFFSLCDEIPAHCIQMHNLILSAFPRGHTLTDPRNFQNVDPPLDSKPVLKSDYAAELEKTTYNGTSLKQLVISYLKNSNPIELLNNFKFILLNPTAEALRTGQRYNRKLINSLVLFLADATIQIEAENKARSGDANPTFPLDSIGRSKFFEIVRRIVFDLDSEGRYLFLEALTSHLRSFNIFTFMFVQLFIHLYYMDSEHKQQLDYIRKQIERVLTERSNICKPHCWGAILTVTKITNLPRQYGQA
eukprot:CAMPEP_0117429288 /NCGR_PEP_ID=MMETSP0758-20121206/8846_1 /TAXON_ID=63605 /ORGANISM="Percolomonas cosmopolitus, Strain AE-1 (ATCC 50343)" /LENGTH=1721 /DNA_ID=CAMNT_0005216195 /DNA_START=764 /DNA_END=5926 /DNA_ORIENTATION=-